MVKDRRRYPRASIGLDITVQAAGQLFEGKTIDLSPYGAKVTSLPAAIILPPGERVQLRFPLLDQDPPLSLDASVVRTDPDGLALRFDDLEDLQFQRLKHLVGTFVLREWWGTLPETGAGQLLGGPAGRSSEPVVRPEEPSVPASDEGSQKERWQALLNRLGLELHLPSNGRLSRGWREFLEQLEANALGSGNGQRGAPRRESVSGRSGANGEGREGAADRRQDGQSTEKEEPRRGGKKRWRLRL